MARTDECGSTTPLIALVTEISKQQQEMLTVLEGLLGPVPLRDDGCSVDPVGELGKLRSSLEVRLEMNRLILERLGLVRCQFC